ncbi:hypothetical protein FPV67DRAFT_296792 [Lyophyllum atratum]|nr:hypothetical protein FPV67DRAFT_296792 [Lyophyllum atratum]
MSVDTHGEEELLHVDWELKSATRVDPTGSKQEKPSKMYHALREIQASLRSKRLDDPTFSQSHIFSFCAPLFVFLCVFVLGVVVPRNAWLKGQAADLLDGGTPKVAAAMLFLVSGMVGGLLILRGAVWVMARLATSFCEMDLDMLSASRVDDSGDEFALTQANLIVGGMLD